MSAARRRTALRDFYKLQEQQNLQDPDVDLNAEDEDAVSGDIDQPGVTVASYVNHLINTSDLRGMVQHANQLRSEIKSLESEQKALVYNNYTKLISAASTLAALNSMSDLSSTTKLESLFDGMANTIAECSKVNIQSQPNASQLADSHDLTTWMHACERTLMALVAEGNKTDARTMASDILSKLPTTPLTDEQARLQSKFEGIAL